MATQPEQLKERLRGRLFLSSMMGWCDAAFCASRAKGCAMVQFGAFVMLRDFAERDVYRPDPEPARLTAFMRAQFDTFRTAAAGLVGEENVPVVSANVFPLTDDDVRVSARAFIDAGGEVYELNAHGGIGNDRERGTGAMLFMPEHREKLMRWARLLVEAGGPVIIKAKGSVLPDFTDHVRELEQIGVHAFHLNVRDAETKAPNLRLVEAVRRATGMFLLASGYVGDAAGAKVLFDAGADSVGIAQAAIGDPEIFAACTP